MQFSKICPFTPVRAPEAASSCTYKAWFARSANVHLKPSSDWPCRMGVCNPSSDSERGCHSLQWVLQLGASQIHLELRESAHCVRLANYRAEHHLVLVRPPLQGVTDRNNNLFGDHPATMLRFM